jgi:hypothetical protein
MEGRGWSYRRERFVTLDTSSDWLYAARFVCGRLAILSKRTVSLIVQP